MSKKLLINLNGNNNGQLKKFLNTLGVEPRIAWYPSAGEDFRALLYLHTSYSKLHPSSQQEPLPPDLFLFTDYFPWRNSTFLDTEIIYADDRTTVSLESIEELPGLNLELHEKIVDFSNGSEITDKALFLKIRIYSERLGSITYPVLYAFAENEEFYCKKLIPNNATISHIIHIRYGGGCCGGGNASGVWLVNVLHKLNCQIFITDNHYHWQSGDYKALELCEDIPKESNAQLTPIRTIPSKSWSGHGDVSWNLVS